MTTAPPTPPVPPVAPPTVAAPPVTGPPGGGAVVSAPGSSSLYVGDLETNVTEAQLYEMFSTIGPVVSIRVCRDMVTRRSLGYAYVNFQQPGDATRAIDMLNFQPINQKPIRIMYSQRDPTQRKSGVGNIFIKNLDKEIDNKTLYDTFAQFGSIVSAKVATDSNGSSKGYGFVQFDNQDSAQQAIDKVNGMLMAEKQVFVGMFQRRSDRSTADQKFSNVYVKNLGEDVDDDKLRSEFEKFGTVTSAVTMKDEAGRSRGFGFVNFETPEAAADAVDGLDGKEVEEGSGKMWSVCRAQKKAEREAELRKKFDEERRERLEKMQGANLYVKNLEDTVDDEKLREAFKEFGTVTSCRVMKDSAGASRGSGFVAFSGAEEATRAVTEMNGRMVGGKPLYVALAQRREDRRARLTAQFAQRVGPGIGGPGVGMPGLTGPMGAPYGAPPPAPGMPGAPPVYYGQPPPGLMPQQPQFGFQPMLPPGMRPPPGAMPQYMVPMGGPPGQRGPGRGGRGRGPQTTGGRGGGRGGPGGMRYGGGMRTMQQEAMMQAMSGMPPNMGMGPPEGAPPMPNGGAPPPPAGPPPELQEQSGVALLASQLANATSENQRMLLGEALYPLVEALEPQHAAKITGMLLEMDQGEVLHLIESPEALQAKVAEALAVLKAAQQAGQAVLEGQ